MEIENIVHDTDIEHFIEIVKCKICFNLSLIPTTCIRCENVFCKDCILNWKSKKNTCPFRCENLNLNFDPRLIKNIIEKFFFKCNKCNNKFSMNNYENHFENGVCNIDYENCEFCLKIFRKSHLKSHKEFICEEKEVDCDLCNSKIKRKKINDHLKSKDSISFYFQRKLKELEEELKIKDSIIHELKLKSDLKVENNTQIIKNPEIAFKFNLNQLVQSNKSCLVLVNLIESFMIGDEILTIISLTNGKLIYHRSLNDKIEMFDAHSDNVLKMKIYHDSNKNYLITVSFDKTIKLWDLDSSNIKDPILSQNIEINPYFADFIGNDLLLICDNQEVISIFDLKSLTLILKRKLLSKINKICVCQINNSLICSLNNNTLLEIDLNSFEIKGNHLINLSGKIKDIFWIDNSNKLIFINNELDVYISQLEKERFDFKKVFDFKSNIKGKINFEFKLLNDKLFVISFSKCDGFKIFSCDLSSEIKFTILHEQKLGNITFLKTIEVWDQKNKNLEIEMAINNLYFLIGNQDGIVKKLNFEI